MHNFPIITEYTNLLLTISHVSQQVLEFLLLPGHLHGADPHREASARLLLLLVDELEEPGDGAGDDAQVLGGVVHADHRVRLACKYRRLGVVKISVILLGILFN